MPTRIGFGGSSSTTVVGTTHDSPRRVTSLVSDAPVGRVVYLTKTHGTASPGRYESMGSGVWRAAPVLLALQVGSRRPWVSGTMYFPGDIVTQDGRSFYWDPDNNMPSSSTEQPRQNQAYDRNWRRM